MSASVSPGPTATGLAPNPTMPVQVGNPDAPLLGSAATIGQAGLLAIVWIFFSAATFFVALRLTVRFRQNASFLSDDYCTAFAWLCLLAMSILQTVQMPSLWYTAYLMAGRIAPDPDTLFNAFPIIKLFWTALWSVKASFMAVFFRLVWPFPVHRRLWYCVAVFAAIAYIGCWLSSILSCNTPADYFRPGKCNSPHEIWVQGFSVIYSTSVDIASDLMIMALPISLLPSLHLDFRRKVGLGIAFSLGLVIMSVYIVRMTKLISGGTRVDIIGLAIWGAIEPAVAVIVGCLLPLGHLCAEEL
ncbi:hypothetical protein N656DRAFT_842370 [Canariomyces notabilis]|uniref:Rhodopsin domain-containing protein n=1 Tax=Canariomyces notabilis TaxID=2074819 RepID=A0AAN6TKA9_9PEZI|nr:hypothetical protein N656DRAFT_842370 [Canariomyces arenarius]